ncbi:transglycosylase SLT domain-containing protein [Georgfuchsia toluolica]|uniref:transglycosylase SLT domain-containing protein n=1 Tax=Georgfuchsia toluolica TaxID=424218 RepID=UPI001FEB9957|nr:transglycosylase SLT domain-containing protein [Georgfuchsia toluolica]
MTLTTPFTTIAAMHGRLPRLFAHLGAAFLISIVITATAGAQTLVEDPLKLNPQITTAITPANSDVKQIEDDAPKIATIDLTVPADDLWQRMRNGFSMPNLNSPLVADRQAWYLNRPDMLKTMLQRSRRYLYFIVGELEKRGMPTELALLPMVESSYNPRAYSSARALGIWQFIPSTGKNYGLEQNWYFDERRDIIASTNAALDYLQYIYELHGDWHLALASYNWGEGAVGRAVAKNKARGLPTDYVNLAMPGETRYYVPKLQALKNIIADPKLFGISIDPISNQPYFGTVVKPATMDVATAAQLAEIPLTEFIALNPAYSHPIMPGSNDSPLVLPVDKVAVFQANLEQHESEDKPLSLWKTYKLKKGEKLDKVAARSGITLARLKQLNGITRRTRVGAGFNILIPNSSAVGSSSIAHLLASLPQTPADPPRAAKKRGKHKAATAKARKPVSGKRPVKPIPRKKKIKGK